ncbi:MAG: alpha/beta fold hydrolase [Gammaproteobacteria bacterium]
MDTPAPPDWHAPHLAVSAASPAWFDAALAHPFGSRFVVVDGCPIHYLLFDADAPRRGLLLVHGGGAHASWWRFIAPLLTRDYRVAALDLSGMGDSGHRDEYSAAQRAAEMRAVIQDAGLGPAPFVVGHSFGGYMTMRFGADYGEEIGGAVIVDSPIRRPDDPEGNTPRRALSFARHYPDFDTALARFRLMPPQPCANDYLVEFIARHSLVQTESGWTWKFDVRAMGSRRWGEPFHEHLRKLRCRAALLFGEKSALVSRDTADYMAELMGPEAPVVEIPEAHHHVMLDQPLAFVAALRTLLDGWCRRAD